MTPTEFKATFRVGDTVNGKWATGKACLITAMGKDRFLYVDPKNTYGRSGKEFVTTMYGDWRLVEAGKRPLDVVDDRQKCCCVECGDIHTHKELGQARDVGEDPRVVAEQRDFAAMDRATATEQEAELPGDEP